MRIEIERMRDDGEIVATPEELTYFSSKIPAEEIGSGYLEKISNRKWKYAELIFSLIALALVFSNDGSALVSMLIHDSQSVALDLLIYFVLILSPAFLAIRSIVLITYESLKPTWKLYVRYKGVPMLLKSTRDKMQATVLARQLMEIYPNLELGLDDLYRSSS